VYIEKFNINPKYEYRLNRRQHIIAYPGKIDKYFEDILASIENCYSGLNAQSQTDLKSKEKVFEYTILDQSFRAIATGLCTNVRREYDPCYDFNWVRFFDINTRKNYCVCQFYVEMKEVN
jgi:hypothetical protein